jgi:hypothetical protein
MLMVSLNKINLDSATYIFDLYEKQLLDQFNLQQRYIYLSLTQSTQISQIQCLASQTKICFQINYTAQTYIKYYKTQAVTFVYESTNLNSILL